MQVNINWYIYADASTLPVDVLQPDFTGNHDDCDTTDIFAARPRRQLWIESFPKLNRPPDELVCNDS